MLLLAKNSNKMLIDIIPSEVYLSSADDRKHWDLHHHGVSEFASSALLTDLDGDGWAREIILWRMMVPLCGRVNRTITAMHTYDEAAAEELHNFDHVMWAWWCDHKPSGTLAMYKLEDDGAVTRLDEAEARPEDFFLNRKVEEWASADLDHDGLADVLRLQVNQLVAYPSSFRKPGELPSADNEVLLVKWNKTRCRAHSMAVADFDNDGHKEILVQCLEPGHNKLLAYKPGASNDTLDYVTMPAKSYGLKGIMPEGATTRGSLNVAWKGVSVTDMVTFRGSDGIGSRRRCLLLNSTPPTPPHFARTTMASQTFTFQLMGLRPCL